MTRTERALLALSASLDRRRRPWALVGGLAVSARTEPRFTRDVDAAVAVADDRAAEELSRDLRSDGYRVLALVQQDARGRLATARLAFPGESRRGVVTDLLFASSGIEREVTAQAERMDVLPGLSAPVARIGHLLALKILSRDDVRRPQDRADIAALLSRADAEELARAREALALIRARGFHRDRDLDGAFAEALEVRRPPAPTSSRGGSSP